MFILCCGTLNLTELIIIIFHITHKYSLHIHTHIDMKAKALHTYISYSYLIRNKSELTTQSLNFSLILR